MPFELAWLADTVTPATTTLALRAPLVFALADTVADPDPAMPPVTLSHDVPDAVVQAQPDCVVTVTTFDSAAAPKLSDVGDTE